MNWAPKILIPPWIPADRFWTVSLVLLASALAGISNATTDAEPRDNTGALTVVMAGLDPETSTRAPYFALLNPSEAEANADEAPTEYPRQSDSTVNEATLGKILLTGLPKQTTEIYKHFDSSRDLSLLQAAIAFEASGFNTRLVSDTGIGMFALTEDVWDNAMRDMVHLMAIDKPLPYTFALNPYMAAKVAMHRLNCQYESLRKGDALNGKTHEETLQLALLAYYGGVDAAANGHPVSPNVQRAIARVIRDWKRSKAATWLASVYSLPNENHEPQFMPCDNGLEMLQVLHGNVVPDAPRNALVVHSVIEAPCKETALHYDGTLLPGVQVRTNEHGQNVLWIHPMVFDSDKSLISHLFARLLRRYGVAAIHLRVQLPMAYFQDDGKLDTQRILKTMARGKTYREAGNYGIARDNEYALVVKTPFACPVRALTQGSVSDVKLTGDGWRIEVRSPTGLSTVFSHLAESGAKRGDQVVPGDLLGLAGTFETRRGREHHYLVEVIEGSRRLHLAAEGDTNTAASPLWDVLKRNFDQDVADCSLEAGPIGRDATTPLTHEILVNDFAVNKDLLHKVATIAACTNQALLRELCLADAQPDFVKLAAAARVVEVGATEATAASNFISAAALRIGQTILRVPVDAASVPVVHRERLVPRLLPAISLLSEPDIANVVGEVRSIKIEWSTKEEAYRRLIVESAGPPKYSKASEATANDSKGPVMVQAEKVRFLISLDKLRRPLTSSWQAEFPPVVVGTFLRAEVEGTPMLDTLWTHLPQADLCKIALRSDLPAWSRKAAMAFITDPGVLEAAAKDMATSR